MGPRPCICQANTASVKNNIQSVQTKGKYLSSETKIGERKISKQKEEKKKKGKVQKKYDFHVL